MTDSAWFSDYMADSLHLLQKMRTDVYSHSHAINFCLHKNATLIESEMCAVVGVLSWKCRVFVWYQHHHLHIDTASRRISEWGLMFKSRGEKGRLVALQQSHNQYSVHLSMVLLRGADWSNERQALKWLTVLDWIKPITQKLNYFICSYT